jgi:glycosyltransferase involved in cell wall biosynthesis
MTPKISMVLATRDRPGLFAEALASVLMQDFADYEIVVIDDGSSATSLEAYAPVWARAAKHLGKRFRTQSLVHRPKGHGQSYSLNFGVGMSRGGHVCFLDDDDRWTDPGHLSRVAAAIDSVESQGRVLDLYMANQTAWIDEARPVGTLWLGTLEAELKQRGRTPEASGIYEVTVDDLVDTTGFCHLNCLTVRRELFQRVGGMDEGIRWECDHDLLLKLMDHATTMVFHPGVMSYHRVPDPTKTNNMTTALGMVDKRLLQSLVFDRALIRSRHPSIRRLVRRNKIYALERMAQELARAGDWTSARHYAAQALGASPNPARALLWLRLLARVLPPPA